MFNRPDNSPCVNVRAGTRPSSSASFISIHAHGGTFIIIIPLLHPVFILRSVERSHSCFSLPLLRVPASSRTQLDARDGPN